MTTLTSTDLNFVLSRLPKDVRSLMMNNKLYCGGGFIRSIIAGEKVNDIDLFGESKESLSTIAYRFASDRKVKVHETDNALTLLCAPRLTIQFITRWVFDSAEKVSLSFDFTICQAVIWYDKENERWGSAIADSFYSDLAARRLVYTRPERNEDAGGSILRVRKFLARGYNIQAQSLARVIARLVQGVKDTGDFKDENWLGTILTSLLREVDPLLVVDGVEIANEHEVIQDGGEVKHAA